MDQLGESPAEQPAPGVAAPDPQPADGGPAGPVLDSDGMGPSPSGPAFVPWRPDADARPAAERWPGSDPRPVRLPQQRSTPAGFAVAPSKVPALITAAVVLLVTSVVLAATMVAHRRDAQTAVPEPRPGQVGTPAPLSRNSIDFTSLDGSGRLVIRAHAWSQVRSGGRTVSVLRVDVEVVCTSGLINYDPDFFQAFDSSGQLFPVSREVGRDVSPDGRATPGPGLLETGSLEPGERARGTIGFVMPRSEVTLLMTDEAAQSATALKVGD